MGWLDNKIRSVCEEVCGQSCADTTLIRGVDHNTTGALVPPDPAAATTLAFAGSPSWDSDGFFDVNQNTKFTVPANLQGRYSVVVTLRWWRSDNQPFSLADRDQGRFYAELATNADPSGHFPSTRTPAAPVVNSPLTVQLLAWEGPLDAGHFIETQVRHSLNPTGQGGYPAVVNIMVGAWLTMRRIGLQA